MVSLWHILESSLMVIGALFIILLLFKDLIPDFLDSLFIDKMEELDAKLDKLFPKLDINMLGFILGNLTVVKSELGFHIQGDNKIWKMYKCPDDLANEIKKYLMKNRKRILKMYGDMEK